MQATHVGELPDAATVAAAWAARAVDHEGTHLDTTHV